MPTPEDRLPAALEHAFTRWCQRLIDEAATGPDKADRATLRRCDTPDAVARTSAFARAWRTLAEQAPQAAWLRDHHHHAAAMDRLAAAVGLAAHLREASALSLPRAMHQPAESGSERPCVSELRFQRLLEAHDLPSLYHALRRVLPLIGHSADPAQLLRDVFYWGDATKKRWAYDYYDPAPQLAAQAASSTSPDAASAA